MKFKTQENVLVKYDNDLNYNKNTNTTDWDIGKNSIFYKQFSLLFN